MTQELTIASDRLPPITIHDDRELPERAEDLENLYVLAGTIAKRCKAIQDRIRAAAIAGERPVPRNHKITKGSRRLNVTDISGLFRELKEVGVTAEDFLRCCAVRAGQVETLASIKAPGGTVAARKLWARELMTSHGEYTEGSPSLREAKADEREATAIEV